MTRETYQIDSVEEIGHHLTPYRMRTSVLGTFVDCLAGKSRVTIQTGVPLCAGCDCHIANSDALCDCTRLED